MVLNQAIAFVKTVELGSISAAARSLRLTAAAASFRIIKLEDHLGVRLLERSTSNASPTEAGWTFYQHARALTESVDRACQSMADLNAEPQGILRVTAPLGFGKRHLAPLIGPFTERYPKVEVRLRLSDRIIDLLDEDLDVAVRMAPLSDSSLISRKISDCPRVLCASAAYVQRRGSPCSPADLAHHACLVMRFANTAQTRWTFMTAEGRVAIPIAGAFEADDGDVLTQWALAGQGVALRPYWEVAGHLRRGELLEVMPDALPEPAVLSLLYPHRATATSKLKAFADFIVSEVALAWNLEQPGRCLAKVA